MDGAALGGLERARGGHQAMLEEVVNVIVKDDDGCIVLHKAA